MLKIIIVGATSGIGREMARIYAGAGHLVGATGRRQELLYSLQLEYPNYVITECFDATTPGSTSHLESMVRKMGGLDILVYSAGWGELTESLDWEIDKATVDVNVNGFLETIHFGWGVFTAQGHGHLVTLSSIASVRGNRHSPAYSASKAFQSTYFEGLHIKARHLQIPLHLTDVQPGFVDTKMAKGPGRFWVAPAEKAARQIVRAIEKKKWRVYITRRWWLVAKLGKWMPAWIYHRIG
ncbi:SDR family NAD(P)-dependent oxidoreductase [Puia dinghuensis]|uniref:Oxidoreductase n=1 Tax=Puia dinghuensis TaxID=1792502 RepID=A0A8J2UC17_9BACT|nr:SDR family NAD(P)-dependent oxidoreductase [Puia dinghuensis]GGA96772.1 oxidoreductase [Puia dinghuensis]